MKTLRIEKAIDPDINPDGAAAQANQPWVSICGGSWVVLGTDDCAEALAFARDFYLAFPHC